MNTVAVVLAFFTSLLLTQYLANPESKWQILDHPNERSLHERPTPRTGGIGVVVGCLVGWMGFWAIGGENIPAVAHSLVWGVLILGLVSLVDDFRDLSPLIRIVFHLVAAVVCINGLNSSMDAAEAMIPNWVLTTMLVLGVVWAINLYNFMDGMDGFAGGMAVIGFGALGVMGWVQGHTVYAGICGIVAAANAGFLVWNLPPAKIFMGDVGSTTMGFCAAGLSLLGINEGAFPWWFPAIVFSPFWVDATVTLVRRILMRERIWEAHRSHYYQRWVRLGWGHRKTVLVEYLLMLAGAGTAGVVVPSSSVAAIPWGLLCCWALVYAAIAVATHVKERAVNQ